MYKFEKRLNYKFQKRYRIPTYDYSWDGYYFVTICTKDKKFLFGGISNLEIQLSEIGEIAKKYWMEIPKHFRRVTLDEWVIMPNHIHGIIVIGYKEKTSRKSLEHIANLTRESGVEFSDYLNYQRSLYKNTGENRIPASARTNMGSTFGHIKSQSLPIIIAGFKAAVTRMCNKTGNSCFVWQSRYYDHVIRSDNDLYNIREYIKNNPLNWDLDRNYPENLV